MPAKKYDVTLTDEERQGLLKLTGAGELSQTSLARAIAERHSP